MFLCKVIITWLVFSKLQAIYRITTAAVPYPEPDESSPLPHVVFSWCLCDHSVVCVSPPAIFVSRLNWIIFLFVCLSPTWTFRFLCGPCHIEGKYIILPRTSCILLKFTPRVSQCTVSLVKYHLFKSCYYNWQSAAGQYSFQYDVGKAFNFFPPV
jgi:hypothetical protein